MSKTSSFKNASKKFDITHKITLAKVIFQTDKTKKTVPKILKAINNKGISVIVYSVPNGWISKKLITEYRNVPIKI